MGNDISCIDSTAGSNPQVFACAAATPYITRTRSRPLITIVSPLDGRAARFKEPLNVGELMLEVPGHFVAEFGREQDGGHMLMRARSRRISALLADSNLRAFHVYYVMPMNRVNTHLATHELHRIVMATRLAPPYPAPYATHTQAKCTKTTAPALRRRREEEEAETGGIIMRRHASSHRQRRVQSPCAYRPPEQEVSEEGKPQRKQARGIVCDNDDDDDDGKQARLILQSQRSMSKPRTWEPKLNTIMELAL